MGEGYVMAADTNMKSSKNLLVFLLPFLIMLNLPNVGVLASIECYTGEINQGNIKSCHDERDACFKSPYRDGINYQFECKPQEYCESLSIANQCLLAKETYLKAPSALSVAMTEPAAPDALVCCCWLGEKCGKDPLNFVPIEDAATSDHSTTTSITLLLTTLFSTIYYNIMTFQT